MWTRIELKDKAKTSLKGAYWKAFLAALILSFTAGSADGAFRFILPGNGTEETTLEQLGVYGGLLILLALLALLIAAAGILFKVFLLSPLEVGGQRYFLGNARGAGDLGELGFSFQKGRYLNIVRTLFFRDLYLFLWTLLLIIPGIVKGYAYQMVPYLLAENPGMSTKRAIELSTRMTGGHKLDMFILDLSFTGWYLLGLLACCIGGFFVNPYVYATRAELYLVLRGTAIEKALVTEEELVGPGEESGNSTL